jgi:single-strand DNA-binding protein
MSLNKCMFIGRLGRDPEVKYTQDGTPVTNFSIAVSEKWTKNGEKHENTTWVNIVAWNKLADLCKQYLAKGREVFIEGKLSIRPWEDKDGNKRTTTEVVASNVVFLGGKQEKPAGDGFSEDRYQQADAGISENDIPF